MGNNFGFLNTLKGLPRSYNKDLQEDKEPMFDTINTITACLQISSGLFKTMKPNQKVMESQLIPEMLATDLAEYLVRKGVPFRETHHISGSAVKLAESKNISLSSLTVADLKSIHPLFDEDVLLIWSYESSVEKKNSEGGTSKSSVYAQITHIKKYIEKNSNKNIIDC